VVVVQKSVAMHELGVATGALNFFRALGATFIVALFSAIVLAGAPMVRGMTVGALPVPGDAGAAFRFVFAAAIVCLAVAIASILALEERPLRGANAASSAA
jgi:hypothetical protein